MAEKIIMPRQGNTVESCIILEWKVKEGDQVHEKTVVCEAETDKATIDVEAGFSGTLLKLLYGVGDDVPVMQPIAIVGQAGEDISGLTESSNEEPGSPEKSTEEKSPTTGSLPATKSTEPSASTPGPNSKEQSSGSPTLDSPAFVSPRARNLAASRGINPTSLRGTGPGGRIIEQDILKALEGMPGITAAALAEIQTSGIPLPSTGSGIGGRVTLEDVKNAQTMNPESTMQSESVSPSYDGPRDSIQFPGPVSKTPIKGIRKIIADRMSQSLATTAQFTLNASAPAAKLQELRARFKSSNRELGYQGITINDILLYALGRTLGRYKYMNAHSSEDTITEFENVHIGMAVDTPRGLMVPVIKFADRLSLKQISTEAKRLTEACRGGTAKPEDLSGSTISVSNVGAMGIESFTPVLNAPEVAILGICAMGYKPTKTGDSIQFEPTIGLSLTINHRVVDGAPAARFLNELCSVIAEVDLILAG